jgi:hypothetical protein
MIELLLLIIVLVLLFGAEATREMIGSLTYLAISMALFLLVIGIVVGLGYAVIANYKDIYIFIKDNYSELFWALMTMTVSIDMYARKRSKRYVNFWWLVGFIFAPWIVIVFWNEIIIGIWPQEMTNNNRILFVLTLIGYGLYDLQNDDKSEQAKQVIIKMPSINWKHYADPKNRTDLPSAKFMVVLIIFVAIAIYVRLYLN